MQNSFNFDPTEIHKFDVMASQWWDTQGPCKPLHELNPLRMEFITKALTLRGKKILDVGCGGGILTESLAMAGADVIGIDMAENILAIAKQHASEQKLNIRYEKTTVETFAAENPLQFDAITCMELLEHVPNPQAVINACSALLKPGGKVFFSTINRNIKAYLFAIIGAEYLLRLLPQGTHEYVKFIRPSELDAWARSGGLTIDSITGIGYRPLTRCYYLSSDVAVNYLAAYHKENLDNHA